MSIGKLVQKYKLKEMNNIDTTKDLEDIMTTALEKLPEESFDKIHDDCVNTRAHYWDKDSDSFIPAIRKMNNDELDRMIIKICDHILNNIDLKTIDTAFLDLNNCLLEKNHLRNTPLKDHNLYDDYEKKLTKGKKVWKNESIKLIKELQKLAWAHKNDKMIMLTSKEFLLWNQCVKYNN